MSCGAEHSSYLLPPARCAERSDAPRRAVRSDAPPRAPRRARPGAKFSTLPFRRLPSRSAVSVQARHCSRLIGKFNFQFSIFNLGGRRAPSPSHTAKLQHGGGEIKHLAQTAPRGPRFPSCLPSQRAHCQPLSGKWAFVLCPCPLSSFAFALPFVVTVLRCYSSKMDTTLGVRETKQISIYIIYIIYIGYYFACWNFFLRTVTL